MSGRGAIAAGLVLIGLGVVFLAREFVPGLDVSRLWPLVSVALGVLLLVLSVRPAPPRPPMPPGSSTTSGPTSR